MRNIRKDKDYFFFTHKSTLHKKDLKFLMKYKAQGLGIYYIILENILEGQFSYTREDILNLMDLHTDESDYNAIVDYLINTGVLYINDEGALNASVLDTEVHKQTIAIGKGKATGLTPTIIRTIKNEGIEALIDKFKVDLSNDEILGIRDSYQYIDLKDSEQLKKWSLSINRLIAKNKKLKK